VTKSVCAPRLIALLSAICLTSIASAQTRWWRTYGGANEDVGNSVQQTSDGGYIVVGYTQSFSAGDSDVYLIKTDAHGVILWTKLYGGTGDDEGASVRQTTDGGYIIAGTTSSFGAGDDNVYLIKTNASGDTLWTRTYGGKDEDFGYSVRQTSDGGYVIAGRTASFGPGTPGYDNVYLIKTNASGDTLWTRVYGGDNEDFGYSIQQTTDGGYVAVGLTQSFGAGGLDVYLIKTNAAGDTLWTRTYGGTHIDAGYSVRQTSDGGYVIAGWTQSFGLTNYHVYLIKTNATGDTLWTRTYGGSGGDYGVSAQQTSDGGYVMVGYTGSFGAGGYDVYLIKTNGSGDTLWTRTYGDTSDDEGFSVQQTSDGGYVIAGLTYSYGIGTPDYSNVYLIKTDSLGNAGVEEPATRHPAKPTSLLVQPNPFTSVARVPGHETELFTLSDVTGRQVAVCKGDRIGAGLRPGVYFLSPAGTKTGRTATVRVIKAAK